jgi:hypothetical protein
MPLSIHRSIQKILQRSPTHFFVVWKALYLALIFIAAPLASAQQANPAKPAQTDSAAQKQLLAKTLAPQDPARYAWVRAAEALGSEADAVYLRLALLDEWLLALEGRPAQSARTIEAAAAQGRDVDTYELQRRARVVWPGVLKSTLRPVWDKEGPDVLLPPELDALRPDLTQEGPGFWVYRAKDGRPRGLYLWLSVRNDVSEPLPLPEFKLLLGRPGQKPPAVTLDCLPPRYSTLQLVPPQGSQHYLCRAGDLGLTPPPNGVAWLAQMGLWFSEGATLRTAVPESDQALSSTGRILAQISNPAVDEFILQTQPCEVRANCAPPSIAPERAARPSASQRPVAEPNRPWLRRMAVAAGVVGALAIYAVVAHRVSVVLANVLLWLALAVPCGLFVRSLWSVNWADSWGGLVVIPASLAALVAPFVGTAVAHWLYSLAVSAEARRRAQRNIITFLLVIIFIILMNIMGRLFR